MYPQQRHIKQVKTIKQARVKDSSNINCYNRQQMKVLFVKVPKSHFPKNQIN